MVTTQDNLPEWPDFEPVTRELRRVLDGTRDIIPVPPEGRVALALSELLRGGPESAGAIFHSAALPIQRAIQILHTDALAVARSRVKLPADVAARIAEMKAQAGTNEEAMDKALKLQRAEIEKAAGTLAADWVTRCGQALFAIFEEHAERQASRARANADAPVIYAKLRKQIVPQVGELRENLRKLADAMKRSGQGMDAAHINGEYIGALENLERTLLKLTPPAKGN